MNRLLDNIKYLKKEGKWKDYSIMLNLYMEVLKIHIKKEANTVIQYQYISPFQQFQILPVFQQQQQPPPSVSPQLPQSQQQPPPSSLQLPPQIQPQSQPFWNPEYVVQQPTDFMMKKPDSKQSSDYL